MSNWDYLLLIYTCMCIILFLTIIVLSFQSHQIRMLSAGLGIAWNRYGLSCNGYSLILDLLNQSFPRNKGNQRGEGEPRKGNWYVILTPFHTFFISTEHASFKMSCLLLIDICGDKILLWKDLIWNVFAYIQYWIMTFFIFIRFQYLQ